MARDVRICSANGRVKHTYVYTCVNLGIDSKKIFKKEYNIVLLAKYAINSSN